MLRRCCSWVFCFMFVAVDTVADRLSVRLFYRCVKKRCTYIKLDNLETCTFTTKNLHPPKQAFFSKNILTTIITMEEHDHSSRTIMLDDNNGRPPPAENDSPKHPSQPSGAAAEEKEELSSSSATRPTVTLVVPPALAAQGIGESDLVAAIRVLEAVSRFHPNNKKKATTTTTTTTTTTLPEEENGSGGGLNAYRDVALRPLRKALAGCYEVHKLTMYNGKDEHQHYADRSIERSLKRQKVAERELQKQYVAKTALRQGRINRLVQLQQDQPDESSHAHLLIADGPVLETAPTPSGGPRPLLLESNAATAMPTEPNGNDNDNGETNATSATPDDNDPSKPKILPKLRSCYCCKVRFRELHNFYDQLCPPCATFNYTKRHATADCSGKVALVTGARVKIGLQTTLKLLRAGATVVAITRFPNDAVDAYRKESDFDTFHDRLYVYGLDLRDVTGIEALTRFLKQKFPNGLDVLVHNACQTIRRPVAYYQPLVQREHELWKHGDDVHRRILSGCVEFERARRQLDQMHGPSNPSSLTAPTVVRETGIQVHAPALLPDNPSVEMGEAAEEHRRGTSTTAATGAMVRTVAPNDRDHGDNDDNMDVALHAPFETTGISRSAAMSQMVLLPEDVGVSDAVLPPGATDVHGQQLDLRTVNSWILKMDQVSTPELMECMFVNAIAPFVLNSRLTPLMCAGSDDDSRPDRFIINVSAMEGKFNRYKTPNHPHTNMAKAALNMMTRTSANDLARRHRIYMNSVDTGWINDENPLERAKKTAETNLFQTPIDEIDAAARILDPVFSRIRGDAPLYGKFLKDYKETDW